MGTQRYRVSAMKCEGCAANVRRALAAVAGVEGVEVDLAGAAAVVSGEADPRAVVAALTAAGYPAEPEPARDAQQRS